MEYLLNLISNMAKENKIWLKEDRMVENFEKVVKIPDSKLSNVEFVNLKNKKDFDKIPKKGGCYWIWTNEPVLHSLHKKPTPQKFNNGEIIYNGIAKDDVSGRIKHHLLGDIDAGWSGISVDILPKNVKSHRKKAMSREGKVPFLNGKRINSKDILLDLNLSNKEKKEIIKSNSKVFYFRNGIDIFEPKHKKHIWRVYFIVGLNSMSYIDIIEKKWRSSFGIPKLCSYISGR